MTFDRRTKTWLRRSGVGLLGVALLFGLSVYFGYDGFQRLVLPVIGVPPAVGVAVVFFLLLTCAVALLILISQAFYRDIHFGALREIERLQRINSELGGKVGELSRLARTDKLTGAWNRRRLEEAVQGEIDRQIRYGSALCLLMLDIDHFKSVNDVHGHGTGDRVLAELAALLRSLLRSSDSLTRWGGEEFVILCPNTALATALSLAERLRNKVSVLELPPAGQITLSIGVAECLPGELFDSWLQRADAALYRAKQGGRNQVRFAEQAPALAAGSMAAHLVQLNWHPAYVSGVDFIDAQHRELFVMTNELMACLLSGESREQAGNLADALLRAVSRHFVDEEAAFVAADYPDGEAHAAMHRKLLQEGSELFGQFQSGSLQIGELFQFLARDLVANHILGADRDYFPYLTHRAD